MRAGPIGIAINRVAVYRPIFMNKLHGIDMASLGDVESTVSIISASKANRIFVDLLPVV